MENRYYAVSYWKWNGEEYEPLITEPIDNRYEAMSKYERIRLSKDVPQVEFIECDEYGFDQKVIQRKELCEL